MTGREPLADLLSPKSIAIVGLSSRAGSIGQRVLANLKEAGFDGDVVGVHPSGEDVDGVAVYRALALLPSPATVAVICAPSEATVSLVEQAGAVGCRAAVVFASGFEETSDGAARAAQLREVAERFGMSVVGPNCLGAFNPGRGLWLTGTTYGAELRPGPVSIVSQSGSGCILLASSGRLGFAYVISSGNETVTGTADYVEYLVDDPDTRAIGLVIEGLREPKRLEAATRRAHAKGVPVVALKVGRTELGARNVASHTGAVAGDARRYEAFCRRAAIVSVADFDELTEALNALATIPTRPAGDRVALVGLSGGELGLVADLTTDADIRLAGFAADTEAELARILPPFATVANPLDGTGQLVAEPERFAQLMTTVTSDPAVDLAVVVLDAPPALSDRLVMAYSRLLRTLPDIRQRSGTPVMVLSNYGGGVHPFAEQALDRSDIPVVHGSRAGIGAVAAVAAHARGPEHVDEAAAGPASDGQLAAALNATRQALARAPRDALPERVVAEVADHLGLAMPRSHHASDADQAVAAATALGFPVVLKTASPKITHKSDVGGVAVGLRTPADVRQAYHSVTSSVAHHVGEPCPDAVVAELVADSVEAFVGCTVDPLFGPILTVGLGGTLVELQARPALAMLPVTADQVWRLVEATPLARLLAGYRGLPEADGPALVDLVLRVSQFAMTLGDQAVDIDMNPVAVLRKGHGVRVLDARILPSTSDRKPTR